MEMLTTSESSLQCDSTIHCVSLHETSSPGTPRFEEGILRGERSPPGFDCKEPKFTVHQMPKLLRDMGVTFSLTEVNEAVEAVLPQDIDKSSSVISFTELMEIREYIVFRQKKSEQSLTQISVDSNSFMDKLTTPILLAKRILCPCRPKIVRCKLKPTTRLLLTVIAYSLVIAFVVAGTGVAISWVNSLSATKDSLTKELSLVLHAVHSFTVNQARETLQHNMKASARMLAKTIEEVGYNLNIDTTTNSLLNDVRVCGDIMDHLLDVVTRDRAKLLAQVVGAIVSELVAYNTSTAAITSVLNEVNRVGLREGHEIILAQRGSSNGGSSSGSGSGGGSVVLTDLKYTSQCRNGACEAVISASSTGSAASGGSGAGNATATSMDKALGGQLGSTVDSDYTNTRVYEGYAAIPLLNITTSSTSSSTIASSETTYGVVYKMNATALRAEFLVHVVNAIDAVNAEFAGTTEVLIQTLQNPGYPLTKLKMADQCPKGVCGQEVAGARAIIGSLTGNPTAIDVDYRGTTPIIATAVQMASIDAFLLLEIDVPEVEGNIRSHLGKAANQIDGDLVSDSLELLVGYYNASASSGYTIFESNYSNLSSASLVSCRSLWNDSMIRAVMNCESGVNDTVLVNGDRELAAFACVPSMKSGVVLLIQDSTLEESTNQLIDYINNQNQAESSTLTLLIGRNNISDGDYTKVEILTSASKDTNRQFASCNYDDPCALETGAFPPMDSAVEGTTGIYEGYDVISGEDVIAAYGYSSDLGLGFVLKASRKELERPLVIQLVIVICTAVGINAIGVLLQGLAARYMLRSIEGTWQRSKQVVQAQKESFERLVSAMYPHFVSERLLAGDDFIVVEVPEATIFFSDICSFSTISNRLNATELLQWIGYTFGVMDQIAEYFHVFKVKTIGDAYFAITGLSMVEDGSEDSTEITQICSNLAKGVLYNNASLAIVKFASVVAQVFSGQYVHPEGSQWLKCLAEKSALVQKDVRERRQASLAGRSSTSNPRPNGGRPSVSDDSKPSFSKCPMRFGVAKGPVTAGVLPGRCPAFDVWGKTVNLACRMEQTGRPGCVQVTKSTYDAMACDPECTFAWEAPTTTYAKGFGNTQTYFIKTDRQNPPADLLSALSIRPFIGAFHFNTGLSSTAASTPKSPKSSLSSTAAVADGMECFGPISKPSLKGTSHLVLEDTCESLVEESTTMPGKRSSYPTTPNPRHSAEVSPKGFASATRTPYEAV